MSSQSTCGLLLLAYSSPLVNTARSSAPSSSPAAFSSPRIAERISVMVSIVATAS